VRSDKDNIAVISLQRLCLLKMLYMSSSILFKKEKRKSVWTYAFATQRCKTITKKRKKSNAFSGAAKKICSLMAKPHILVDTR